MVSYIVTLCQDLIAFQTFKLEFVASRQMLLILVFWDDLAAVASWNPEYARLEMLDGVKIEEGLTS